MSILGWVLATAGSVLVVAYAVTLVRANPGTRISLWRRAETVPERATQSLTFGSGAVIFSGLFLTDAQRYVPAAMYLIALLCLVTVLGVHNWRLRRKGGSQNAE